MSNYRQKIYSRYTLHTGTLGQTPEKYLLSDWGNATLWFIRGWLPENKDIQILDLGCGSGTFLQMAEKMGYKNLNGVDLSPDQVAIAKRECPNANIVLANAFEFLAESKNQYDLITGFDFIEHLKKDEILELMDLLFNALKKGGRVIVQTPNPESPWGMAFRYGDLTHELAVSPRGLEALLAYSNFTSFKARECGPYPHGIKSSIRYCLWFFVRSFYLFLNVVETGNKGSGIYTRVFVATFTKKEG